MNKGYLQMLLHFSKRFEHKSGLHLTLLSPGSNVPCTLRKNTLQTWGSSYRSVSVWDHSTCRGKTTRLRDGVLTAAAVRAEVMSGPPVS